MLDPLAVALFGWEACACCGENHGGTAGTPSVSGVVTAGSTHSCMKGRQPALHLVQEAWLALRVARVLGTVHSPID